MTKQEFDKEIDRHFEEIRALLIARSHYASTHGEDMPCIWNPGMMVHQFSMRMQLFEKDLVAPEESMRINHGG